MARTKVRSGGKPSENSEKEKPKKEILKMERPLLEKMLKVSCCCSSVKDLESLMNSFLSELEPYLSISDKTKASVEEEKQKIKQRLIFFNSVYREIPEPKRNLGYLSKMSDLLAHYVGAEVFASADPFDSDSREGKDLISRIVTTLYASLDSSEDHILDTVMKLGLPFEEKTSKKDVSVYSELFRIVVKKAQKRQVSDLTYMRYVLVFRLWKKMIKTDTNLKETVIKEASTRLWPPPGFVKRRWSLPMVLPKPPKHTQTESSTPTTSHITEFFLREKYNVRKAVKKFLEETSKATHQCTMFPNLSCDPRLLNPKIREFGPLPPLDAPLQEFSTFMSTADDVWQRLHEEPHSESSVFEQVTNLKKIPICTPNRVFNLLHRHHLQHKARKAEMKKRALQKACFRGRPVIGGVSNLRIPGSLSDAYSLSAPNTSSPVHRNPPVAKTHKRRILESPDIHLPKKSKSDLWEDNHMPVHPSYGGPGSLRKDKLAKVSPFSENTPKSLETAESSMKEPEKVVKLGCSSNSNLTTDVKSQVKEEPNRWQSGPSCHSAGGFSDPDIAGKLAIEKEVEQTLQMLQKSKPAPVQNGTPSDISPIKTEGEPTPVVGLETPVCVRSNPDVVPDWSSMWGSMGYLAQPQDLNSGEDIWLDELLDYPSSSGPEGQDFWSLIAGDETVDNS